VAHISDELRHLRRKDLAPLRVISDQGANGNAALEQATNDQAAGPAGCSNDKNGAFGHFPRLSYSCSRHATKLI
jgi:hypothetical protein